MKSFSQYVKYRESSIGNAEDQDEKPLNPSESNDMNILYKLIRIAWRDFNPKTKEFFNKLAMSSPEIANEFKQLAGDDHELKKKRPHFLDDQEEVRPPESDAINNDYANI